MFIFHANFNKRILNLAISPAEQNKFPCLSAVSEQTEHPAPWLPFRLAPTPGDGPCPTTAHGLLYP